MMVRVLNGVLATLGILAGAASCEPPPKEPSISPPTVVHITAVTGTTAPGERGRPNPPRIVYVPDTTTTAPVVAVGLPPIPAPQSTSWPSWRTTTEGVPFYKGRPSCTPAQAGEIAAQFAARGASIETQQWAIYVASREGGCNYLAVNIGRTDDSHCTFQLNAKGYTTWVGPLHPRGLLGQHGWTPTSVKASLSECARAAADLWASCGKGPWIKNDYSCRKPQS